MYSLLSPVRVIGCPLSWQEPMWSKIIFVLNLRACFSNLAISSGPKTPSESAGQLSTSVVVINCPPCAIPVIKTGLRLALAA